MPDEQDLPRRCEDIHAGCGEAIDWVTAVRR
jgi:hypothetical protein